MLPGETAVLELILSDHIQEEPELRVTRVNGGYRDPFGLYD